MCASGTPRRKDHCKFVSFRFQGKGTRIGRRGWGGSTCRPCMRTNVPCPLVGPTETERTPGTPPSSRVCLERQGSSYGKKLGRTIDWDDVAFESVEAGLKVVGANAVHMGRDRLASGAAEQRQKDGGSSGVDHIWGDQKKLAILVPSTVWWCAGRMRGRQVSGGGSRGVCVWRSM